MVCKFRRYDDTDRNNLKLIEYTCDDLRENHLKWKEDFRKRNGSAHMKRDWAYDRFCEQLDEGITNCKCKKESQDMPI